MAWKKYFTPATNGEGLSPVSGYNSSARPGPARTNYSSYLPDVYTGSPNRIDRYSQYEVMDSDPEINAALDILAEFCTQKLKDGKSPFTVQWRSKATNSEVRILGEYLQQWNKLQLFDTRIFRIVRNTFKYGDSFFIRDPETQKWCWVDAAKIVKVIVNESDGKKPEQYVIKDLAPNFESLVATQITPNVNPRQTGGAMPNGASFGGNAGTTQSTNSSNRWGLSETEHAVSAEHVIHLSLSEGLDNNYPFGNSLLENIFKVYKQKELLEDAILIYRIQRAPERRIFHIDVGNMPAHLAMAFVERVKNEIHQRRIPSQTGGGCFAMDTRVPLLDGRILSIADLALEFEQGKENWAYSCNPETREMVPGIISWAGVTQKAAKVIELTLDNGEKIICTPEHKFPIVGKGKTEAKDIVANEDSLISLASDINQVNKVVSIMELDAPIEVGTLTIDGDEINHNFHTFAIEQGVYTFNSNVIDSAYNPMCLDLSTKIPLLDGRVLSLSDIITEFEQGRQNWIYSCDPSTGKVMPGVVDWAGVTRRNTNTIKITLDNGEILIVTPDHKIPVFGKGFVEAQDLIPSDRLISFITTGDDYQQIWDHATNEWLWTHKMVGGFFKDKKKHQEFTYLEENCHKPKTTIHYKDGNTLNNDPRNIGYMGEDDHTLYHYTRQKSFWQTVSTMDGDAASEIAHIINKWDTISDKEKLSSFYDMRKEITYTVDGHANFNNLELTEKEINPTTKIVKIEKVENRDVGTITVDGKERWHSHHTFAIASGIFVKNSINEDYFFPMTADGRGSKVDTLPGGCFAMETSVSLLDGRELSIREIEEEMNAGKELWTYSCEPKTGKIVPGLISWAGVTHKSAKVMKLTLDNGETITCTPCHKFPQYDSEFKRAGEFIIGDSLIPLYRKKESVIGNNVYEEFFDNADKTWKFTHRMISDYFKDSVFKYEVHGETFSNGQYDESIHDHIIVNIEYLEDEIEVGTLTIDGDEIYHKHHTFALSCGIITKNSNLGEINDLQFFTNKLFRGLRIPSSYLPTGADDSQANFNDGRVGTAYIQELRFNKYCERLQSLITHVFDEEFKLYMDSRGVNIDSSLFELQFNPPMNFASSRQASLDTERINTFNTMQQIPYMSKRFALKRFLGLTDEEVADNERLWGEESGKGQPTHTDAAGELRSAGLSAAGIEGDMGMAGNLDMPPEMEAGMPPDMTAGASDVPPPAQ